jgi:TolB-like protein/Tfp pilus assembly protein PilF
VPDIFLSYNREDQPRAKIFADAFEALGFDVWWDVGLRTGEAYDEVTENALRTAKAVVVLWSKKSVQSRWVRAEATLADRNKTLLPCMIEPCERPIMFELTQTAELGHWQGDAGDPTWATFLSDVKRFVAKGGPTPVPAQATPPPMPDRQGAPHPGTQPVARPVLAVLPFVNRSGLKEDDIFAIGMVEDIIDALSLSRAIRVLSSGATAAYRKNAVDVVEIARQANVRYLLEGNVRRVGETLRVTAQLIDATDGAILWTQKFDRPLSELAALQEDLVMEVAAHLGAQISRVEMERALKKPGDLNAWESMLRAMAAATRGVWDTAVTEAEKAVTMAPESGSAHATLAFAYSGRVINGNADAEWSTRAHRHIARALELDATNPSVHLWVGWSLAWCLEPEKALPYLEQTVRARPSNSVARHGLGAALLMLNRNAEALAEWEMAERLAPGSPSQYNLVGFIGCALLKLGRFDEALERFDQSLRLDPTFFFSAFFQACALECAGRHEEAVVQMRRAIAIDPLRDDVEQLSRSRNVITGWWRNHPDLPAMRAAVETLWEATREPAR